MLRFLLRESGRWALALLGALAIAVAVSALEAAGHGYGALMARRLVGFLSFDFGTSALSGGAAVSELAESGPVTLRILLLGSMVTLLFGVPLGLLLGIAGLRRAAAPLVQAISSVPVFCAGLALAYAAQHLEFAPEGRWSSLLLPAIPVGLAGASALLAIMRAAASQYQDAPFRAGLRRLGLSTMEIERIHVLPQVLAHLFDGLGEIMLTLLSACVVSEWVFAKRGIADLFVRSVALQDWNMAALILFVFAVATLTAAFAGRIAGKLVAGSVA